MELSIDDNVLERQVDLVIKKRGLVPREILMGKKITIDEYRKRYCCNHSRRWVQQFIVAEHPETLFKNGGFVINPFGNESGMKSIRIREYQAALWHEKHDHEIDWNARLEKG